MLATHIMIPVMVMIQIKFMACLPNCQSFVNFIAVRPRCGILQGNLLKTRKGTIQTTD